MLTNILKSIFPDKCVSCHHPLHKNNTGLCQTCIDALPNWPKEHDSAEFALQIFAGRSKICRLFVLSSFHSHGGFQKALHHIKYEKGTSLARALGMPLGLRLKPFLPPDALICPVPLHYEKQKLRGYNQSHLIAEGIGEITGVKITEAVSRNLATPTQTALSRELRWKNVESAFSIRNSDQIKNKVILLVDDTLTTGATLEACSKTLLKNGAGEVWAATLGYAP